MAPQLTFNTPIVFPDHSNFTSTLLEKVDDYFYLGGKKAHVLAGLSKHGYERIALSEGSISLLAQIAKFITYCTVIIPLAMLTVQAALRSTHKFKILNFKEKLEKRIDVTEQTAQKISRLIPQILNEEETDEIEWLSTENNLIFKLKQIPHLVFKMDSSSKSSRIPSRFDNMVKAKEICKTHELGLLVIPHAKLFTVNSRGHEYFLIAEEYLDFNHNETIQEELHYRHSSELNETLRQLAKFVAKTGFHDVVWRNIPLLNEKPIHGHRRIALIDLEHMNPAIDGYGFISVEKKSNGLIKSVWREQIDIIFSEAKKNGIFFSQNCRVEDAKKVRLEEIDSYEKIYQFYNQKGIKGNETLNVDLASLGLDLTEFDEINSKQKSITLKEVAEDVIDEINLRIQKNLDDNSLKEKRLILFNTSNRPFNGYSLLKGTKKDSNEDAEMQFWIPRILKALQDKGYIFEFNKNPDSLGYVVQT